LFYSVIEFFVNCLLIVLQHPELFRWFKDFVGFKEGLSQPEPAPSPLLPQPRQERITGDAAMEIGQFRFENIIQKFYLAPLFQIRTAQKLG
jgi:hypothetical protein